MSSRNKPGSNPLPYNGEVHGALYSPEYAVHINIEQKREVEKPEETTSQGELYSPETAIHISTAQQNDTKSENQQQVDRGEAIDREAKSEQSRLEKNNKSFESKL